MASVIHLFYAWLVILMFLIMPWFYARYTIWYWKRSMRLQHHLSTILNISKDLNGFYLSKQARVKFDAMEYVYGEIDLAGFVALMALGDLDTTSIFYDLGSGTGKTTLLCAMIFPIKKSCGIELLTPLHRAACLQHQRLSQYQEYKEKTLKISYIHGDFLTVDFSDATVIFINASAFFGETWMMLNHKINTLIHCRTIITTTKPLIASSYQLTRITRVQMSWGIVAAFIHKRKS